MNILINIFSLLLPFFIIFFAMPLNIIENNWNDLSSIGLPSQFITVIFISLFFISIISITKNSYKNFFLRIAGCIGIILFLNDLFTRPSLYIGDGTPLFTEIFIDTIIQIFIFILVSIYFYHANIKFVKIIASVLSLVVFFFAIPAYIKTSTHCDANWKVSNLIFSYKSATTENYHCLLYSNKKYFIKDFLLDELGYDYDLASEKIKEISIYARDNSIKIEEIPYEDWQNFLNTQFNTTTYTQLIKDTIFLKPSNNKPNIFHIVLDAYSGYLAEDNFMNEEISKNFNDFTLYNNVSSQTNTFQSKTEYITGNHFKSGNIRDWFDAIKTDGLLNELNNLDYNILQFTPYNNKGMIVQSPLFQAVPLKNSEYDRQNSMEDFIKILDLTLLRISPAFLRSTLLNESSEGLLARTYSKSVMYTVNKSMYGGKLFADYIDLNLLKAGGNYIYLHLFIPHYPYYYTKDCRDIGMSINIKPGATLYSQTLCATNLSVDIIDTLKGYGLYEDSIILIHSDHGEQAIVDKILQSDMRQKKPKDDLLNKYFNLRTDKFMDKLIQIGLECNVSLSQDNKWPYVIRKYYSDEESKNCFLQKEKYLKYKIAAKKKNIKQLLTFNEYESIEQEVSFNDKNFNLNKIIDGSYPMLLLKLPYEKNSKKIKVDNRPIELIDIPNTILGILSENYLEDNDGINFLENKKNNKKRFFHNGYDPCTTDGLCRNIILTGKSLSKDLFPGYLIKFELDDDGSIIKTNTVQYNNE